MRFISDKITFTPAMKSFAEETLQKKLNRVLPDMRQVDVKLTILSNEKLKLDLSINNFRVQTTDEDFYDAFIKAAAKIKAIIIKNNKKAKRKAKINVVETAPEDVDAITLISKEKTFDLKPITIEAAIDELEHTDYIFYVFKNVEDDANVAIIYKRLNGDYGLIKCR